MIKKVLLGLVAVIAIAVIAFFVNGKKATISISDSQINMVLKEQFPIEQTKFMVLKITMDNPHVKFLKDTNKIQVALDVTLDTGIKALSESNKGSLLLTSSLRYEPTTQEFFLNEVEVTSLTVEGVSQKHSDAVREYAGKIANGYLERFAVYKLEDVDEATALAKQHLKDVKVENRKLKITLGL